MVLSSREEGWKERLAGQILESYETPEGKKGQERRIGEKERDSDRHIFWVDKLSNGEKEKVRTRSVTRNMDYS